MLLNRTSVWKVMTIKISRDLQVFNFERLNMWCGWIGPPSEMLWPFEFLESFRCSISSVSISYAPESDLRVKSYDHLNFSRAFIFQFRVSRYIILPNRASVCNFMTIGISRELPLFNFERLGILCSWIGHPCEKLWPLEFLETFLCSISSVSICDAAESDLWVKCYDHSNFSRASVVQLWASRYMMQSYDHLNFSRVSEWNDMTFWISRELPYSISSISIYYITEFGICV